MENLRNVKVMQVKAVKFWMDIVRVAAKSKPEPGEIGEGSVKARFRYCQRLAPALLDLIQDEQIDEDGLLYALVTLCQIYGTYVGVACANKEDGFHDIVEAGRHMIVAYQALLAEREPVTVGAVH
jgi:hypothetical protein